MHVPQFTCGLPFISNDLRTPTGLNSADRSSQDFAFSAFFHSSESSAVSPDLSFQNSTAACKTDHSNVLRDSASAFIGFSWGPLLDAFPATPEETTMPQTPRPLTIPSIHITPKPFGIQTLARSFHTPMRAQDSPSYHAPPPTGTIRRTAPRRNVSDREAMRQLADCVGMSAREKVLESGRKPRVLHSFSRSWQKEPRLAKSENPFEENSDVVVMASDLESDCPPSPSPSHGPSSALSLLCGTSAVPKLGNTKFSTKHLGQGSTYTPDQNTHPQVGRGTPESGVEQKHRALMGDIRDFEQRLATVVKRISSVG